jgi:iron(II)-dependent oxidoreductase
MQYINPYSLLGITPQELTLSPKLLRSAKRRVLAEIELEESVIVDGIKIERSDALRIIDELDEDDKREFHSLIFYDENLREFLTIGYTDWFFEVTGSKTFEYAPFINFLTPYYANQFNNIFFEAVKNGDLEDVQYLQKSPIVLEGEFYDLSRQKVKKYFAEELGELEEKLDEVEKEKSVKPLLSGDVKVNDYSGKFYNPFHSPERISPIKSFKNSIFHEQDIKTLNELTDDFQSIRDKTARTIQNIAAEIHNELGEHETSLIIFQLAEKLKASSQVKKLIKENSEIIKKIILKQNLVATNELLNKILAQSKERRFVNSRDIKFTIDLVVGIDALNAVSSNETNNAIINVAILLSDTALVVSDSYSDADTALNIIDKALEIRIKDPSISSALLQRLVSDRYQISLKRDLTQRIAYNSPKATPRRSTSQKTSSANSPTSTSQKSNYTSRANTNNFTNSSPKFSSLEEHSLLETIKSLLNYLKSFPFEHTLAFSIITALTIIVGIWLIKAPSSPKNALANNSNSASQIIKTPVVPAGMAFVEGSTFSMGRFDNKGDEAERPGHRVTVKSFFMDIYETTNEQYAEFVRATNHQPPAQWKNNHYPKGEGKFPVTGVDWGDASAYVNWKGKRLPTEEEWEFAARGKDSLRYPWSNEWIQGKSNAGGEKKGLVEVGTYKGKSPFGIYDMIGNTWEWTASDFKAYPGGSLPSVFAGKSNLKTIRGGSFETTKEYATATYRIGWSATEAENYNSTGFRCAKSAE